MPKISNDHERMVERQLAMRGISSPRILDAFRSVAREDFVPLESVELAYADSPLAIGEGQTISQPYIVAFALEALSLRGDERVLEVGTGSGYAAAILGRLAREVYSIERIGSLALSAAARLQGLGVSNVRVLCGDGSLGWPARAPYDAIVVAASGPRVPDALRAQLAQGGRLVMPVGDQALSQTLVRVTRTSPSEYLEENLAHVRFVPLIGAEAWSEESADPEARVSPAPRW